MESRPPLVTRGLTKSYRVGHIRQSLRPALVDLDLEVRQGEILGYVGPNGSGKTTTLKLLTGLLRPDRGEAHVFGQPLRERGWRQRVGFLPEHPYLYDYLTPTEYLAFAAPVGQQQIRDTKCGALTLNQASSRQAFGSQPDDCW